MKNKEILKQIVECLTLIALNPNVYSGHLKHEVEKLSNMIEEETNEEGQV